jgi:hypothetical protein
MTLYVNGDLVAFKVLTGKIRTTTIPFLMGQMLPDNTEYNFKGVEDEVKIFDYALSPVAIASLFKQSTTPVKNLSTPDVLALNISPNPASNVLNINFPYHLTALTRLTIRDIAGKNMFDIFSRALTPVPQSIQLDKFPPGVYIIHVQAADLTFMAKFIKV